MYYEANIKHDIATDTGEVRQTLSKVLVHNANLFAEAEAAALKYAYDNYNADNFDNEPDVTAIRRSRICEFTNNPSDGGKIYVATLDYTFTDDSGKEKHTKYLVGIYADDITKAKKAADFHISQGLQDLTLTDLNETRFEPVVEYHA